MSVRLILIFRFIISALFIFSTIAKLLSLPFFDGMVAELFLGKEYYNHPTGMFWVQLLVRILIAGEFLLGLAILQGKYLKSIVLPAIFLMLFTFTIHLFFAAIVLGKGFIGGNCGCFGDLVPMDNFESILKNIVSMGMVVYLFAYVNPRRDRLNSLVIPITVGLVSLITLFLTIKDYEVQSPIIEISPTENIETPTILDTLKEVQMVDSIQEKPNQDKTLVKEVFVPKAEKPIVKISRKPKRLLDQYANFSDGKKVDLYEGDKLICMFSLTCGHCQSTYKDICGFTSSGKLPDTYILNFGSELDQNYFFSKAGCKHPHVLIEDYTQFQKVLEGKDFPRVIHMRNGTLIEEWSLDTYSKDSFAKHFGIEIKDKSNSGLELELESEGSSLFGDY